MYSEWMSHSYNLVFLVPVSSHTEQKRYIPFLSSILNTIGSQNTSSGHNFNLFFSDTIFAWHEKISLMCNFETVSSLCAKNNARNGLYTQKKMDNGPGSVYVAQVEVKLCTEND